MKLTIDNISQFNDQTKVIINDIVVRAINVFDFEIKNNIAPAINKVRGSSTGSIADPDSIVYTPLKNELVVEPTPLAEKIFTKNATEQRGSLLHRSEAEDWFAYHNIKRNSVRVRPTGDRRGGRPPLGNQERKFFENTYKYISSNAQKIIDSNF